MRIAYIVTRADPIGGAQIHVRDLAAAAQALGHSPVVITSGSGPFVDALQAQGTPTVVLRHLSVPIRPLRDLRALQEIHAVLKDLRPDLIAAHSSKAGILGRLAGRSLHIPVVFTAMAGPSPRGYRRSQQRSTARSSASSGHSPVRSSRCRNSIGDWRWMRASSRGIGWSRCTTACPMSRTGFGRTRAERRPDWSWWPDLEPRRTTPRCYARSPGCRTLHGSWT